MVFVASVEKLQDILKHKIKAKDIFKQASIPKGIDVAGLTVQEVCNHIPLCEESVVKAWHRMLMDYIRLGDGVFPIRGGPTGEGKDRRGMMTRVYSSESAKEDRRHDYDFFYCDNDTAVYHALLAMGGYVFWRLSKFFGVFCWILPRKTRNRHALAEEIVYDLRC